MAKAFFLWIRWLGLASLEYILFENNREGGEGGKGTRRGRNTISGREGCCDKLYTLILHDLGFQTLM